MESDRDLEVSAARLAKHHALLHPDIVRTLALHAAVALQQSGHSEPVAIAVRQDEVSSDWMLRWLTCDLAVATVLDTNRVTEDGAEAVALCICGHLRSWRVHRRLQRGESADWLLLDEAGQTVALEVSGVRTGDDVGRIVEKQQQVAKCRVGKLRVACVVQFELPRATLRGSTAQGGV